MKRYLLSLLLLGVFADQATAQFPAVAERVSDSVVRVSLPEPPPGTEYHSVSISSASGGVDLKPARHEGLARWGHYSTDQSGYIEGILCSDTTCTAFRTPWSVGTLPDDPIDLYRFGLFVAIVAVTSFLVSTAASAALFAWMGRP